MKSYIRNCHIFTKNGDDVLFSQNEAGEMVAQLDGYAIIPMEQYTELTCMAPIYFAGSGQVNCDGNVFTMTSGSQAG